MRRVPLLVALTAVAAVTIAGCGGATSDPQANSGQSTTSSQAQIAEDEIVPENETGPSETETGAIIEPGSLTFEVLADGAEADLETRIAYGNGCTGYERTPHTLPWWNMMLDPRSSNCPTGSSVSRDAFITAERTSDSITCRIYDGNTGKVLVEETEDSDGLVTCDIDLLR